MNVGVIEVVGVIEGVKVTVGVIEGVDVTVGVTVGVIVADVPIEGVTDIVTGGVRVGVGVGDTEADGVAVTGIPKTENLIAPIGMFNLWCW